MVENLKKYFKFKNKKITEKKISKEMRKKNIRRAKLLELICKKGRRHF